MFFWQCFSVLVSCCSGQFRSPGYNQLREESNFGPKDEISLSVVVH
jgi:hypothetical protein